MYTPILIVNPKYNNKKILPENMRMTDHFKRQEQTDPKQDGSMVVVKESIAAYAYNKDDNKQSKDD
jgi:hypothetical protein